MGGWLQFGRGELGWGRRRGNRGGESRQSVYKWSFYLWNHRRMRVVGISVDDSNGERATLLYGDPGLNPSVSPSVKSSEKIPRHHIVSFFKILHSPSVNRLVYTNGIISSIYSNRFADGMYSVGIYQRHQRFVGIY